MIYRRVYNVPTWRLRSPFEELIRMRQQMDRLFDDFSGAPLEKAHAGVYPAVNVSEDKENYYVHAELPGIKADEIDIQATGNSLSISGERKIQAEDENARYHRREREAGNFSRMISLPDAIESDKVQAKLEDGILTVALPKSELTKPRQIAVQ
jgi:HSP20 family protein